MKVLKITKQILAKVLPFGKAFAWLPYMMRVTTKSWVWLVSLLWISSCAYESEEELFGPVNCDPQQTTYSQVIQPIIAANCALSGCHDGGNTLPNWTIFDNVQANAQLIKTRTSNRTMPPSNASVNLTAQEIDDIACWVDSGAQNN